MTAAGAAQPEVLWDTRPDVSPLRYPGGKRRLAPFVAGLMRRSGMEGGILAEPFAGGAAVTISLLEAGTASEAAIGDADPMVSAFWTAVFSPLAPLLAEMAAEAEMTLEEWRRQKEARPTDVLAQAFRCLYLNRTSFSGSIMDYAGPMGGRSQAGPDRIGSRFNREALARRILELSALSDRIRFVQRGCWRGMTERVRRDFAGEQVFWYLDPPYFAKARRLYQHSFTLADHEALAAAVDALPGSWLLSYDDHPDAGRLYAAHPGFARVEMRYSVRVDGGQKRLLEVAVSDVIARLRANGDDSYDGVVPLPALRSRMGKRRPAQPAKPNSLLTSKSLLTTSAEPSKLSSMEGAVSSFRDARASARTSAA